MALRYRRLTHYIGLVLVIFMVYQFLLLISYGLCLHEERGQTSALNVV